MRDVHKFDNGVVVYDEHLLDVQRSRYEKRNVHEEDEEDIFIEAIDGLDADAYYVSVGTAIGYYPILARRMRKDIHIHCFEPLPRHLEYFRDNIELNDLSPDVFGIHNLAVSTKSGNVELKDKSYGSSIVKDSLSPSIKRTMLNLLKRAIGKKNRSSIISVDSIPLTDVFQIVGSQEIDFLQMDIQGHEQPVLTKYFNDTPESSGRIKSFLVGTHGLAVHESCRKLFSDNGYDFLLDEQNTENQPDGILYCRINSKQQ